MEFRNLGRIIFVISVIVFLINIFVVYPKIMLVSFIPLFFGGFSFFILPKCFNAGPGISISLFVMLLRYIVSPFLLSNSFYSFYLNDFDNNSLITFGLIVLEMIIILLMIRKYHSQNNTNNKPIIKNFSYVVPIVFLIISVIWSLNDPIPLTRYNFILSPTDELVNTDLSDSGQGLPRILNYTHYFIIISLFFFIYKLYVTNNKTIILIIGFLIIIALTSFYQDTSRNSMLIPLLAVLFLGIKSYPKYKKMIFLSLSIVIFSSMSILSMLKFFNTTDIEKNVVSKEISAKYINDYFGGYYEVYAAVKNANAIKSKIDNKTLFNDVFGQIIFVNRLFDLKNRSSEYYNQTAYSDSHIIPTISQGFCYFGFMFSWIFTFIVFRFIFFFDGIYFKTNRIDHAFIFALCSISLGWLHPGSFVIATSILSNAIVLYLILCFSTYLGKLKQ